MPLLTDVHPQEVGQHLPGAHFPAHSRAAAKSERGSSALSESRNPSCALQLTPCLISTEQHPYLTHFNLEWNGYFLLQKVSPASQMALGMLPALTRALPLTRQASFLSNGKELAGLD